MFLRKCTVLVPPFPMALLALLAIADLPARAQHVAPAGANQGTPPEAHEEAGDPPPSVPIHVGGLSGGQMIIHDRFRIVQVNTDANGNNILGDAANEPSITVDPQNPRRMAIGWRQFDTIASNFRQAGVAHSSDGGLTWDNTGPLDPGVFRSDPVLDVDNRGNFYYNSLTITGGTYLCDVFSSQDSGASWSAPVFALGGDKSWMAVDRSGGMGDGHLYFAWDHFGCCGDSIFNRSTDSGSSYSTPIPIPGYPIWGTLAVDPDGAVYVAGRDLNDAGNFVVAKSTNAQDASATPSFDFHVDVDLGGNTVAFANGPNPGGLSGQVWIAAAQSGPYQGDLYLLSSVDPPGSDPLDVRFSRSTDGGQNWSTSSRVNPDPPSSTSWQWFGTMSVAPNGRIDVVWNDTKNSGSDRRSQLHYTRSFDGGSTWTPPLQVSPMFDSWLGWPNQSKIGDYYDMVSFDHGAHLAFSATFNGEQDVYYVRLGP